MNDFVALDTASLINVGVEHVVVPVHNKSIESLHRNGRRRRVVRYQNCQSPQNREGHYYAYSCLQSSFLIHRVVVLMILFVGKSAEIINSSGEQTGHVSLYVRTYYQKQHIKESWMYNTYIR